MANVTIRQVAAEAQVSTTSVSRILNGSTDYRYDVTTQLRVREAAERLGYQANAAARLLRQQQKNLVGLVVKLTEAPHINRLMIAVRDELLRHNYEPVLLEPKQLTPAHGNSPFPSLEMLAGVLSIDLAMEVEVPEFYQRIGERMPVIALYPTEDSRVESVHTAQSEAVEIAARHLVELGHHRIAFAGTPDSPYPSDYLKVKGWKRAVKKYKLDSGPACLISIPFTPPVQTPDEYAMSVADFIVAKLEQLKPRPTALICSADEVAMCVLGRLSTLGWRLPNDLSVVGFDGIHLGSYSHPPLTTIAQPVQNIAQAAVERLQFLLAAQDEPLIRAPLHREIAPTLLIRSSTARTSN